jgi:hypothetical protein
MNGSGEAGQKNEELLRLRRAAFELGISFPTIEQWIYQKKIRGIRTVGEITAFG